jgi:DNA-binding PadR family transcriptional regulator
MVKQFYENGAAMSKNELAVLGLLNEKPMYGYEIHQEIKRREMDYWAKIKLPSIYNTLTRLEEQRYIQAGKEKVGKMPERTVYAITPAGQEKLKELVINFLRDEDHPEWNFGVGVAFIFGAPRDVVLETLQQRRESVNKCIADLRQEKEDYQGKIPFNWIMLIEHGQKHMQLELDWLNSLIEKIKTTDNWTADFSKVQYPEGGS